MARGRSGKSDVRGAFREGTSPEGDRFRLGALMPETACWNNEADARGPLGGARLVRSKGML